LVTAVVLRTAATAETHACYDIHVQDDGTTNNYFSLKILFILVLAHYTRNCCRLYAVVNNL